ncbi:MAG: HAD family hydrolase [Candidatus Omnitrophica bacterium]|nr:HAD family hydrolase [Candidatus Omnitrophota bacterium]
MEKIIFLDRDGVINRGRENGYITCWDEFEFLPGVFSALRKLTEAGFKIIIVSNQQGVGKRLYSTQSLADLTERMLERIKRHQAKIWSIHYCPHLAEDNCACRKPKPGLFKQAVVGMMVDFKQAYFIGDTEKDVQAGRHLGMKTILVLSGNTKKQEAVGNFVDRPDFIAEDLAAAVDNIVLKTE